MSEQEQQTQPVSNELTERVNNAFIANGYTLLNGGVDNVVMVSGDKDDKKADMLLTLEGMGEIVDQLKKEVEAIKAGDGQELWYFVYLSG